MLSEQMLTQWRRLVDFKKAMNLLRRVMRTVSYGHTATAIETASKVGAFVIIVLFVAALAAARALRSK